MIYSGLADIALLAHLLFIIFVVFGGLLVFRWQWIAWLHLPAAAWGAIIEFLGWVCPLTYLENDLRNMAGEQGYGGGFIEHYLVPIVYPAGLTPATQYILGGLVIVVNFAIYGMYMVKKRSTV